MLMQEIVMGEVGVDHLLELGEFTEFFLQYTKQIYATSIVLQC
jgi:hypothetical protein